MSDVVTTTTTTSAEPHMYNAHLKKVLKSYQTAAMTSLNGPSSCMAAWAKLSALPSEPELKKGHHHAATPATTTAASVTAAPNAKRTPSADDNVTAKHVSDLDPFLAPPPFPIQQMPILTAPDQSRSERSETVLEGETISCFIVGGEKRLCLPQILNSVLRDFSLQQINAVCDELQIFCSRCNHEQLEVLKLTAILPFSAPSCGLITKTDAERLCNALLHSNPPRIASVCEPPDKRPFHFKVYHECFGKCKGIYTPDHYVVPHALCIECTECRGQFSPQKFVCHAHKALENRTCHWGFDSANWRSYILLATDQHNTEQLQTHLDEMKNRFDYNKYKRKQYEQEEKDLNKKAKYTADESSYMSYVYDPVLATYWYPPAWSRVSAFRPWSPMVSKDGKQSLPSQQSSYLRENVPQSLPSYLSHGPPVLLNPERVVPISETERFERHYQPNVALAPPSAQLQANQKILASVTTTSTSSYYSTANTGKDSNKSSEKLTSKEGAILPTEVDISTDTDETFSDSNASAESVDYVPEKGLKNGGEIPLVKIEESKNALIEEKDTAPIRKLLELRGVKQEILEDVMKEVEKLKERYRQELVAVLAAKKTYQQEVELIKSSRKEKLREAIEAKRNLRKELELVRTEHEKKLREALETQQQLRRELEANRNRRGDKINEVAARVNLTAENEQLRSRLEATENELQKLRSEMEKDSTTDGNTETLSGPSHLPSPPSVKLLSSPEKTKTQSTLLSVEKTKSE